MEIHPYIGVGNLLFSDTREEIRKKLNKTFVSGVKEFGDIKDHYDFFEKSDLMVFFDAFNTIVAFEFYSPKPIFNGVDLLNEPFNNVVKMFAKMDADLIGDSTEFTSNKYGIGGMISYNEDESVATAESIIIFKEGYYET